MIRSMTIVLEFVKITADNLDDEPVFTMEAVGSENIVLDEPEFTGMKKVIDALGYLIERARELLEE